MIAHLVYDDMFERYGHYLKNIPAETDIIITTNTPEKEARLKELYGDIASVRLVTNRGRDMSALLVGCRDILMKYEFFCFVHDKKSSQKEFASVGAEFDRLNWENMLHSEGYIRNIIGLFKAHSYLGMLSPFGVDHGSYFYSSVDYWTVCYDVSCALAQRIGIKTPAKDKQPLAIGTCFWCRASAMRALLKMTSHMRISLPSLLTATARSATLLSGFSPMRPQTRAALRAGYITRNTLARSLQTCGT